MVQTPQQAALSNLIQERREDYASLSRLLGRNPAYIQQFIKRGTPRRLSPEDVKTLANYFGVPEGKLVGPAIAAQSESLIRVPRLDVDASAGYGAVVADERSVSQFGFDKDWLRNLCRAGSTELSVIRVQGDSMFPTLADGEDILVDGADGPSSLRDGIYVLRREDALMVKRVAVNPSSHLVDVASDNSAYPTWRGCKLSSLNIIGRVIWAARRVT